MLFSRNQDSCNPVAFDRKLKPREDSSNAAVSDGSSAILQTTMRCLGMLLFTFHSTIQIRGAYMHPKSGIVIYQHILMYKRGGEAPILRTTAKERNGARGRPQHDKDSSSPGALARLGAHVPLEVLALTGAHAKGPKNFSGRYMSFGCLSFCFDSFQSVFPGT